MYPRTARYEAGTRRVGLATGVAWARVYLPVYLANCRQLLSLNVRGLALFSLSVLCLFLCEVFKICIFVGGMGYSGNGGGVAKQNRSHFDF